MARVVPEWVKRAKVGTTGKKAGFKHGFRSGLEVKIGEVIEAQGQPVVYEKRRIRYIVPASQHHYTFDFELENGILIEGKGIFDSTDRAKHLFVKAQYPELDIRFVFTRSASPISPGSATTLAMWCQRHGFKFADKVPPVSWFHETGPLRKPADVLARGPFAHLSEYPQGYDIP